MPAKTISQNGISTVNDHREKEAQRIIRRYAMIASGAGFLGKPFLSTAVMAGTQVMMVRSLCNLFQRGFDEQWLRVTMQAATSSLLTQLVALGISKMPGMGRTASGFSGAGIAGMYTATVGEYYKIHFQCGGRLQDASLSEVASYFVDELKRGDISVGAISSPLALIDRMFIK